MRLINSILPNWTIPFSIPFGIAIFKILIIISCLIVIICEKLINTLFFLFNDKYTITKAATAREIIIDIAMPTTPALKTKIPIAFPTMLIAFITTETIIGTREFPIALNNAAPES